MYSAENTCKYSLTEIPMLLLVSMQNRLTEPQFVHTFQSIKVHIPQ
jgi:hypothetical protein